MTVDIGTELLSVRHCLEVCLDVRHLIEIIAQILPVIVLGEVVGVIAPDGDVSNVTGSEHGGGLLRPLGIQDFIPLDGAIAGGLKILLQLHFLSFDLSAALDKCNTDDRLAVSIGFAAVGAAAGGQADGGHHGQGRRGRESLGALLDLHGFLLFLLVSQDISSNRCSDIHQQPCLRCRSRFVSCTAVCNVVILIIQLFPSLYKSETRRWQSCFLYNLQLFVFVGIATFLTITQVSSLPAFPQERRHRPAARPWWSGSTGCRAPAHRNPDLRRST